MKTFLKILFVIFLFASVDEVYSQSVMWRQIIGEQYNEIGENCIELRDGGYLMAGFKNIVLSGTPFFIQKSYLVRLDHYGNILWEKLIGDSATPNNSVTLIEDPFGNIYLPYYSGYAHLVKLSPKGEILWIKDYSSYNIEVFRGISFGDNYKKIVLLSQNLIQGFYSTSSITKLDSSGNMIWNKAYYDSIPNISVYTSSNNSFFFSENSYYISGSKGIIGFIIKTDTSGNIIWNKRYIDNWGVFSIAQNSENTFVASCQADAAGYLYCQKFDSSGNIIWSRNYRNDSLSYSTGYTKIIKNSANNFALGTIAGHNYAGLLIIDSLGKIITSKFYYYPQNFSIEQNNINNTSDSGYIVAGSLDSNNTFESGISTVDNSERGLKRIDALIFKIDKYGNTVSIRNNSEIISESFEMAQNYPNPFNPSTVIRYSLSENGFISLKVFDLLGKEVVTLVNQNQIAGSYSVDFNGSNLSSGIFFYKLEANNFSVTKRMLLVK